MCFEPDTIAPARSWLSVGDGSGLGLLVAERLVARARLVMRTNSGLAWMGGNVSGEITRRRKGLDGG